MTKKKVNTTEDITATVIQMVVGLIPFGLALWGMTSIRDLFTVQLVAAVALGCAPLIFFAGFWFGKVEVRGFLSGVDTALDKITAAVDFRDDARTKAREKSPSPVQPTNYNVYLPNHGELPPIRQREIAQDRIIDL